jgi:Uma2 family endonuclease
VEFALSDQLRLRPDVSILVGDKIRQLDPDRIPIPGAPDIAIEIISPSERASDSQAKVAAYLRNGVSEVWQFYPKSRMVQIHKGNGSVTLSSQDQITTPLLPGLALAVSTVLA